MDNNLFKGKWKQIKGEVKNKWGKLNDDDLQQIEGNREKLIGKIQEKYGLSKEEAKKELNDWIDSL